LPYPGLVLRIPAYGDAPLPAPPTELSPRFAPTTVQHSSLWAWFIFRFRSMNSLNSFIFSPATLSILMTVFLSTPTVSAVPLMLPHLTSAVSTWYSFSYGSLSSKNGVSLFSENVFLHVLHLR